MLRLQFKYVLLQNFENLWQILERSFSICVINLRQFSLLQMAKLRKYNSAIWSHSNVRYSSIKSINCVANSNRFKMAKWSKKFTTWCNQIRCLTVAPSSLQIKVRKKLEIVQINSSSLKLLSEAAATTGYRQHFEKPLLWNLSFKKVKYTLLRGNICYIVKKLRGPTK